MLHVQNNHERHQVMTFHKYQAMLKKDGMEKGWMAL